MMYGLTGRRGIMGNGGWMGTRNMNPVQGAQGSPHMGYPQPNFTPDLSRIRNLAAQRYQLPQQAPPEAVQQPVNPTVTQPFGIPNIRDRLMLALRAKRRRRG